MFPIRDENRSRNLPVVTIAIIAVNALAFFWQLSQGIDRSVVMFGLIPAELVHGVHRIYTGRGYGLDAVEVANFSPAWVTLFSSMFMHGGWLHILGNMWFLWIFGDNVEDAMGSIKYGLFYLVAGLAAAAAQVAMGTDSLVPMVGASGAIGGVLGAYLILFPRARVQTLITLGVFFTTTELPAIVVLGLWFVMQLVSGLGVLGMHQAGGVAFAAHVGGFVCGLLLGRLLGSAPNEPNWNSRAPYPGNDRW